MRVKTMQIHAGHPLFEAFARDSRTERLAGANAKAACFECHAAQAPGSYVFGRLER